MVRTTENKRGIMDVEGILSHMERHQVTVTWDVDIYVDEERCS